MRARVNKSSSSQESLISLSPNLIFRTTPCDIFPVLQSDWIAVYAATGTTQCISLDQRVWLRETTLLHASMNCGYVARTHCSLARIMVRFGPSIIGASVSELLHC